MEVATESIFPFIIASLRTSWTDSEMKSFKTKSKKLFEPLQLSPLQKKHGVDLYSLVQKKRVGWKTNPDGTFQRTASWRKRGIYDIISRNRRWKYDLIIYVDNGVPSSSGHGGGFRPTYAQLFEQFLQPNGWIMITPRGHKSIHVPPLAPALGYHVTDILRIELQEDFISELDDLAKGKSRYRNIYSALSAVGKSVVEHIRTIMDGGLAPQFSRKLSSSTIDKWRPWRGISGSDPLVETGEMIKHIHWKIVGWEKEGDIYGGGKKDPYDPTKHAHTFERNWRAGRSITMSQNLPKSIRNYREYLNFISTLSRTLRRNVILNSDQEARDILAQMQEAKVIDKNFHPIEPQNIW